MVEYALRELSRRKRRTIAALAGYAAGVAVISIILTVLFNGERAADSVLKGTGTHFTAYYPSCPEELCQDILLDKEHEGFFVGLTRVRALDESVISTIRAMDSVADAAPFVIFRLSNSGAAVRDFTIGGMPPGNTVSVRANSCSAQDLVAGRFLTDGERSSVMLEEQFARSRNLETGRELVIAGKAYAVVGIVDTGIRMAKADVYLTMAEAKVIINSRLTRPLVNECGMVLVESKDANSHERAVLEVKTILGSSAGISSYACYKPAAEVMGINSSSALLMTLVISVCLLAFSLQSRYASVSERRFEIGILAAVGWRKSLVVKQILWESVILAAAGWAAGCLLALAALALIPSEIMVGSGTRVSKQVYPLVFAFCLFIAGFGGVLAGLLPGLSAASRNPAECLRKL
jgi:putative ABC transport system permease protein